LIARFGINPFRATQCDEWPLREVLHLHSPSQIPNVVTADGSALSVVRRTFPFKAPTLELTIGLSSDLNLSSHLNRSPSNAFLGIEREAVKRFGQLWLSRQTLTRHSRFRVQMGFDSAGA
jgi:hypothetical protein